MKVGIDIRSSGKKRKANLRTNERPLLDATADAAAHLLHAEWKESILKAISKLPVTQTVKTRYSLKFVLDPLRGEVDMLSRETCNLVMCYVRNLFTVWWYIEPGMSFQRLKNTFLKSTLHLVTKVTEVFYTNVFLLHCETILERAWSDFKRDQFGYIFDYFKNGGSYSFLSIIAILFIKYNMIC